MTNKEKLMSRWSRSLPVFAVVGAVAIAGCGGSDYPSKPNDICKQAADNVKKIPRATTRGDLHVYFLKYQKTVTDAASKLKAVKPPNDKRAAYQSFLAARDQVLVVVRRVTNTVASNPTGALRLVQRQVGLTRAVVNSAKAAGLTQCAKTG